MQIAQLRERLINQMGSQTGSQISPTTLGAALLALLVFVAYGNSLTNGFVFDDAPVIQLNPLIQGLDHVPELLTTEYWEGRRRQSKDGSVPDTALYRPLPMVSYNLNYAVGGFHPFGYHLLNLLLHLLATWLVYRVALSIGLTQRGAILGGTLFAVHPLHTEAVAGIVGRAELMMAAGVLGALWLVTRGRVLLALVVYAGALLSKEQAVMFPGLLVLYGLCFPQQTPPGRTPSARLSHGDGESSPFTWLAPIAKRVWPFLLLLAVYLLLRLKIVGHITSTPIPFIDNPTADAAWYPRVLTAIKVAGFYLWLSVWPASLSADYSYQAIPIATSILEPKVLMSLLTWGGLLGLAGWTYVRGDRRVTFAIGLIGIMFFPTSNLMVPIGTIMGERLFYLPSAGLCLLVGIGWERLCQAMPSGTPLRFGILGLISLVCLALTVRTIDRNRDWVDSPTLFRQTAEAVPSSAKAQKLLGIAAIAEDKLEEADAAYDRALELYPEYTLTNTKFNTNLGALRIQQDRLDEAIEILERAVALAPRSRDAQYNLGLAYAQSGRYAEAETSYRRALALDSEVAEPYNSLSYVLRKQERYLEALEAADTALKLNPDYLEAHYNRGRALEALGNLKPAIEAYRKVVELDASKERVRERLEALQAKGQRP